MKVITMPLDETYCGVNGFHDSVDSIKLLLFNSLYIHHIISIQVADNN